MSKKEVPMQSDFTKADATAAACSYILHCLLQRLEKQNPGLVMDLLQGVKADHESVIAQEKNTDLVAETFKNAIAMLELCHAQSQMAFSDSGTSG